ncbi:MAG: hypothetical protein FJ040_04855 [Chloroflexi bacterium]|nr:hypothetical protein [Chloroflexota bacterium]
MSNQLDNQDNEITLLVGSIFTFTPEEDRAAFEEEREWVSELQDNLRESGVVVDLLANPGTAIWEGGVKSYGDLYRLRQVAAYIENGQDITPLLSTKVTEDEDVDPLLERIFSDELMTQFPHLIKHQGDSGYYLPVDFAEPIWIVGEDYMDELIYKEWDEEEEIFAFGSSPALQRELHQLSVILNQMRVPTRHPIMRCLESFREGVSVSVQNDLPLIIW